MASNSPKFRSSLSARLASSTDPPQAPTVTFARRTNSGRYVNYSRDDLDSDFGGSRDFDKEYASYVVQIPPTPDNQLMKDGHKDNLSNSLFTGGFNNATRAHLMDKVIDSEASHLQMARAKKSSCSMPGCDGNVTRDGRQSDILPCECDFKICAECFSEVVKIDGGMCPGCKEPYKYTDMEEVINNADGGRPLSLPPTVSMSKMDRRLSVVKSIKLTSSQTGDWDHNKWLFDTKGTYGYGNAIWPTENGGDDGNVQPTVLMNKPWRPLTRKLKIPAAIISPYRMPMPISYRKTKMQTVTLQFILWRILDGVFGQALLA